MMMVGRVDGFFRPEKPTGVGALFGWLWRSVGFDVQLSTDWRVGRTCLISHLHMVDDDPRFNSIHTHTRQLNNASLL